MKYLLFAGPGDVGKTTIIGRMARNLRGRGYRVVDEGISTMPEKWGYGMRQNPHHDFYVLLEKNGKFIVVYSWGDTQKMIQWLADYIKELQKRRIEIFLVIAATRDASEGLYNFTYNILGLNASNCTEIPMGRMVRGERRRALGMDWYINSMTNHVETFVMPEMLK